MIDPLNLVLTWAAKLGLDKIYSEINAWISKPSQRGVLIIGPGGVGKSTLATFLGVPTDGTKRVPGEYIESVSTETFKLTDDLEVQIVVPPGQSNRRDATWTSVLNNVKEGKFRGIILILANGNHALGDISFKNHRVYDETKGFDASVEDYVADCLITEEKILKVVCDAIHLCDEPIWLLTLVTKQDLWWNERDAVESRYSTGKYARILKDCLGRKSEDKFRHEAAYVSLVIRNLETGRNEILKNTVAGYDTMLQERSFERLFQIFKGLMSWENQHDK